MVSRYCPRFTPVLTYLICKIRNGCVGKYRWVLFFSNVLDLNSHFIPLQTHVHMSPLICLLNLNLVNSKEFYLVFLFQIKREASVSIQLQKRLCRCVVTEWKLIYLSWFLSDSGVYISSEMLCFLSGVSPVLPELPTVKQSTRTPQTGWRRRAVQTSARFCGWWIWNTSKTVCEWTEPSLRSCCGLDKGALSLKRQVHHLISKIKSSEIQLAAKCIEFEQIPHGLSQIARGTVAERCDMPRWWCWQPIFLVSATPGSDQQERWTHGPVLRTTARHKRIMKFTALCTQLNGKKALFQQ